MSARTLERGLGGPGLAHAPVPPAVLVDEQADPQPRWQAGDRLQHVFEQRCAALVAAGRADHLAVDAEGEQLGYAQLDARANRLARHLLALGVRPGQRVALLLPRSAWSYAGMLAVLKLHAAYVPLDPSFPAERIAYMVLDAGVSLVVSTAAHRALLAACGAPVCEVDDDELAIASRDGAPLGRAEAGEPVDELCYVIYTSGSTGRPKGVPIDHGQACNFVRVAAGCYGYRHDDRVYQGLTLAFDFAVEEIWVPLAVGATLVPNATGAGLLGPDLQAFLQQHRVSALCCVPTLLATLDDDLPALRLLIVSGEACPRDLVERWARPGRELLNAYGPTEITVTATVGRPRPGRPVTIGRPLPTYSVLVLEPGERRLLPRGEVGEIVIGGIGVARGYLNREDATRKAFIDDFVPLPHNPSGRLYRTGDLGRIRDDGEVEYLGRIDSQVKIRGYRIELAEIESLLLQQPGIAQAVVNPWTTPAGSKELVAYVTLRPGAPPRAPAELAAALARQLPPYMVPAWFEVLDTMPMLASDKADRQRLPPPRGVRQGRQDAPREHHAPDDALAGVLANELAALLGLPQVSARDHFFDDLGTHSLLMAQYCTRLRRALPQHTVSMRDLYAHPTVQRLANALAQASPTAPAAPAGPVRPAHVASAWAHAACGTAQLMLLLAHGALALGLTWWSLDWTLQAADLVGAWARAAASSAGVFCVLALLPVAAKWLLVGRWTAEEFPAWSWRYLRFWTVKALLRASPAVLWAGTPLYTVYLRLLGARVHGSAMVALQRLPVATDLLDIGADAVLHPHAVLNGYRLEGGRVRIGPVRVGNGACVGDQALVDIDTELGDGARLAHASSLHPGQRVPAGACWWGSPGRPAPAGSGLDAPWPGAGQRVGAGRRTAYALAQLAWWWGVALPLPLLVLHGALGPQAAHVDPLLELPATLAFALGALLVLAGGAGSLLATLAWPRLAARWLPAGREHRLYGLHHALARSVQSVGNSRLLNQLFGDSSAIVHVLRALGWRFPRLHQTGSNLGLAQQQDLPHLCSIGRATMISDGLTLQNMTLGPHAFRSEPAHLGERCFVGNAVLVPPGHAVGDDCLLGTKVLMPLDGALRQGTGLLGSPPFPIPRSVQRDRAVDPYQDGPALRAALGRKNRSNTATALQLLASHALLGGACAALWHATHVTGRPHEVLYLLAYGAVSMLLALGWYVLVDALSRGGRPLQPMQVSIYEPAFWRVERHWKLGLAADSPLMAMLAGTPMRAWLWRALGVQVGRQLLDDGCAITEKTLTRLGNHCTLGDQATLQAHSLEDGLFKAGRVHLGDGCTVGARSYVHYDVQVGDGAVVQPDAFVMKGSMLAAGERWGGNPAQPQAR